MKEYYDSPSLKEFFVGTVTVNPVADVPTILNIKSEHIRMDHHR